MDRYGSGLYRREWTTSKGEKREGWQIRVFDPDKGKHVTRTIQADTETEALEKAELIRRSLAGGLSASPVALSISGLCREYLDWADTYYRDGDGNPTGEANNIRDAIVQLKTRYGVAPVSEFGPLALKQVREDMIAAGLARTTINSRVNKIRRMFKWGVSEQFVPASVHLSLTSVDGLKRGRTSAQEAKEILPVSAKHIEAAKAHLSSVVCAMIDVQVYSAARPGEIIALVPSMLDTSNGDVWIADLAKHKTAYRGRVRRLYFGPRAIEVLRGYIDRPLNAPMFSPKDALTERYADATVRRRPNQKPNPRQTDRIVGEAYTVKSYRQAIVRACEKAGIAPWTPLQLRHTSATDIRRIYGLEAAQVILGHATADVTQVYAEADEAQALQIARERG